MNQRLSTRVCAYVVAGLMVLFVLATGLPYFNVSGQSASLSGFVWFPYNHGELETAIGAQVEGFLVGDIVGQVALMQAFGVILAVLAFKFTDNIAVMTLSGAFGIGGLIAYLASPALSMGGGVYWLMIAMFVIIGALSVYCVATKAVEIAKENKAYKAQQEELEHKEALAH